MYIVSVGPSYTSKRCEQFSAFAIHQLGLDSSMQMLQWAHNFVTPCTTSFFCFCLLSVLPAFPDAFLTCSTRNYHLPWLCCYIQPANKEEGNEPSPWCHSTWSYGKVFFSSEFGSCRLVFLFIPATVPTRGIPLLVYKRNRKTFGSLAVCFPFHSNKTVRFLFTLSLDQGAHLQGWIDWISC